jgi:hypothetical protein
MRAAAARARQHGVWRNATLDEFTSLGLLPATGDFPPDTEQIMLSCAATA